MTTSHLTTGSSTPRLTPCPSWGRTKQTDPTKWSSGPKQVQEPLNLCTWASCCLSKKQTKKNLTFSVDPKSSSCRVQLCFCVLLPFFFGLVLVESKHRAEYLLPDTISEGSCKLWYSFIRNSLKASLRDRLLHFQSLVPALSPDCPERSSRSVSSAFVDSPLWRRTLMDSLGFVTCDQFSL